MLRLHVRIAFAAVFLTLTGCGMPGGLESASPVVNLDARLSEAAEKDRPLVILVIDRQSSDGTTAADVFEAAISSRKESIDTLELDVSNSRNRATAARFHPTVTPLLLCLSPHGLIVSRDEKPASRELMLRRIDELPNQSRELDAKRASLEQLVAEQPQSLAAQMQLAEFEQNLHNDREAIPHLKRVAESDDAGPSVRVRAWVNLVRAHLWILEPENGRHEAKALIALLGGTMPEARAGGLLMLGIQDANAKRFALARQEFDQAIAAAPDSSYAREAIAAKAKLSDVPK